MIRFFGATLREWFTAVAFVVGWTLLAVSVGVALGVEAVAHLGITVVPATPALRAIRPLVVQLLVGALGSIMLGIAVGLPAKRQQIKATVEEYAE